MKSKFRHWTVLVAAICSASGCSTAEMAPLPIAPPADTSAIPALTQVPHPAGHDLADLKAIFQNAKAPTPEFRSQCDSEFKKLGGLTQSAQELREGARELVRQDPVAYHWCFYGKLLDLEAQLKSSQYVDERQKGVLDTYGFLVPVARAFQREFNDSRYLRWALQRYRRLSEYVFFRRVEMSPKTTSELAGAENSFGNWRAPTQEGQSVLSKYGLTPGPSPSPSPSPSPDGLEHYPATAPTEHVPTSENQAP